MAPRDAVNNDHAPPFGEGIRVPVAFEVLYNLLVAVSALGLITLTVFVDNLRVFGHLCGENSTVRLQCSGIFVVETVLMRDSIAEEVEEASGHVIYHRAGRKEIWLPPVDLATLRSCGLIPAPADTTKRRKLLHPMIG